jgi:exonuclease SbcC
VIIRRVRLEPFGRFSRWGCDFEPGLNVVLGPNEAGKTTLVNAIHAVLFIPAGVRKNSLDWKNIISRYLPHPHGDTARVTLEFTDSEGKSLFRLRYAWGTEKEARLVLDKGTEITDEANINQKLIKLLRYGRGTYEEVFLARQAELVGTLDRIKEDQEALNTLAEMLRTVVFQSGGISVDELENKLLQNMKKLEDNWEFESDTPRGGRDIDNPYRRNVGQILEQFYLVRELQQKLKGAQQAEEALESAVQQLQKVETAYRHVENKGQEMKRIEGDVNRRNALEPQLEACELRQKQLKKITLDWPKKEERKKLLVKRKENLIKEKEKLEKELAESQKELEIKKKRALYHKAKELREELNDKKEELGKLPSITPEKMQALADKEKKLSGLQAEIGGMKLKIRLTTEKTMEVKAESGLKQKEVFQFEGEKVFEAQGRFRLEAPGWGVDIQSGVKDVEALLQKIEKLEGEIKAILQGLTLSSVAEARKTHQKAVEIGAKVHTLAERFKDALAGHSFDDLKGELAAAGAEKAVRDPVQINKDVLEKEFEFKDITGEIDALKEQLAGWQAEYSDHGSLLEAMVELMGKSKEIKGDLEKLAPLPEGFSSAEAFLSNFRELEIKKEILLEELQSCRENKIKAEGNMPEESPEEITGALRSAEKKLQDLKSEAAALRTVKREFYKLKEALDVETFQPFQELFLEYLSPLTGYRYSHARMEEALPKSIAAAGDTAPLPLELLSCGTISGVALALRLAMARYLLGENEGFIVMDDPLVDLDPERKKQAAVVLQKAAENKQIIITTFDPDTAALLGGHLVEF